MYSRRTLLASTLGVGALAGLAACGVSTSSSTTPSAATSSSAAAGSGGPGAASSATLSAEATAAIAKFTQASFTDPANGNVLKYNLFVPDGADGSTSFPLVLFMEDSSVVGSTTTAALTQGLGALCWATASDQAKRPCFVLAPQYESVVVNDSSLATSLLDTTVNLVRSLTTSHKIDTSRLYTTGQSMGGMMSIAIDIKYPDLFAASYLVACQWDASLVAPMVNDNLWITVSEGDTKAYPGENAILAELKAKGATYTQAQLDGSATAADLSTACATVAAKGTNINYTTFKAGTLPTTSSGGMEHMATWTRAYSIESIREWIFTKKL
ncbi:MAG: PHB depolymerase family esterase [Propionibacteriaceae bacterium]|nr:pyrroline-5-carboxylate reductase [Micropruina sp.]HBX79761.1 pyrroline-5-carboxylate reductase [Propionibacteriaceae bacterium]HBY24592.1 pyrroline-5-carboxylate reductase [Propionibacteriaceae bacterium]